MRLDVEHHLSAAASVVCLAACATPAPTSPPVTLVDLAEDFREVTYPVQGADWTELMSSVRTEASVALPMRNGEQHHAETLADLEWTESARRMPTECTLEVHVALSVVVTLPEWLAPLDAKPSLRARWDRYLEAKRVHEHGHRDIALQAARALQDAATDLGPRPGCTTHLDELEALGTPIRAALDAREKAYDDLTEHGIDQAAWSGLLDPKLPPLPSLPFGREYQENRP